MRAKITKLDQYENYSAKTENNILLVFSVNGEGNLKLNDEIELDLKNILETKAVTKLQNGTSLSININEDDIHDLDISAQHGGSRVPSKEHMSGI